MNPLSEIIRREAANAEFCHLRVSWNSPSTVLFMDIMK